MADIPNSRPIPFTFYKSLDAFRLLLQAVMSDVNALWADDGTPEIAGGNAVYTLVLRRSTLLIQCAKVRAQQQYPFTFWCDIDIEFIGDASTQALFVAFIRELGNALPDGESPLAKSAKEERDMLKYYAELYAKPLRNTAKGKPGPEVDPAYLAAWKRIQQEKITLSEAYTGYLKGKGQRHDPATKKAFDQAMRRLNRRHGLGTQSTD